MIEIISIYSQLIIFLIIFQFPLNKLILKKIGFVENNYFNVLIYNILIQSFFYLIISFISLNFKIYFFLQIFFGLIFLFLNFLNLYKFEKNLFLIMFQ